MVRLTGVAALLLAAAQSAIAFKPDVIPGAYILELDENQDSSSLLKSIESRGKVRRTFDHELFKGVSVQLDDTENSEKTVKVLASTDAVKRVWPVSLHNIPDVEVLWTGNDTKSFKGVPANHTGQPFSPHVMTQVDKLHAKGITGKGIKIAVIDTGIDYKHPALGGCFGDGCLVSSGTDFVGDDYTGRNDPVPDSDPMDCEGHGTHLAGSMAAQNNTLGVLGAAPGVTLGAYRVFGCWGAATDEVLLAAFMQAYDDGADIISLSLGQNVGWSEHPWSVIISRLNENGVPCVVAAGNSGDTGVFLASSPGDGKGVAAVAATENVVTPYFLKLSSYETASGKEDFLYTTINASPPPQNSLPLFKLNSTTTDNEDGCDPLPDDTPDLGEYLVLLKTGGCDLSQKAENIAVKGGVSIVTYLTGAGVPAVPTYAYWNVTTVASVDAATGETWIKLLEAGEEVNVSFPAPDKQLTSLVELPNNATGGSITHFSSWGPTWDMDVKPQFAAPGGSILSTFPLRKGGYAVQSGTSMATPLVAAIYALLGEARGTLDPELLQNLLSSTSIPGLFNDGKETKDFLAPVAQQGAGSIQAYDAAFATTVVSPSSLSFNDTDYFAESMNFTLKYDGDEDSITFKISDTAARTVLALNSETGDIDVFPNEMVEAGASLGFSDFDVTVKKGETVTVKVTATPPDVDAKRLGLWSGWINIRGADNSSYSLPYQGLVGSLHDTKVLQEDNAWISRFDMSGYPPIAENVTWNLPPKGTEDLSTGGTNVPLLIRNYSLGTAVAKAELVPVTADGVGEPVGLHSEGPTRWLQRGRHIIDWGGKLDNGEYAEPGTYQFRFKALRIRGDESKEEDWDVSMSQVFSIMYQEGNSTSS